MTPRAAMGRTVNVSAGGLGVRLDRPVEAGERCTLWIRTAPGHVLFERARVVWVQQTGEEWSSGLAFVGRSAGVGTASTLRGDTVQQ